MARTSRLFRGYELQLAARLALFAAGIVLFVAAPQQLDPGASFGLAHGVTFIDVAFVLILLDDITKFLPHARIAVGSLKQYRDFHLPTARTFRGGAEGLRAYGQRLRQRVTDLAAETGAAASETWKGLRETALSVARSADLLRLLPVSDEDLTAVEELRRDIRRRRLREILPVLVFWVVANALVAWGLSAAGWLTPEVCVLWSLFYFVFDMVCVVAWCPLQLFLMRNRCCTTCQIFNWDAIMVATPLVFAGGWYSWILVGVALAILARWELAFVRHPERFDERTNAALSCAHCADKLCARRGKFVRPQARSQAPRRA